MRIYMQRLIGDFSPGVRRFIATESLFGMGTGIWMLIFNLHLLDLGLSANDIGKITSIGALSTGLLSLPAGMLIRFVGRKTMLVFGMSMTALALAGFGFAAGFGTVLVCQLVWSVGLTAIVTSEIQLIFQFCRDKKEETKAYSLLFAMFTLFTGVGTLIGGYLPGWIGGSTTVYQYSFFVAAACFAAGSLLRGLLLPASGRTAAGAEGSVTGSSAGGYPESETAVAAAKERLEPPAWQRDGTAVRTLTVLCVAIFLAGLMFGLLNPYLNVIVKYRFHWNDGAVSLLLTVAGLFLFAGSLFVPYVLHRVGLRKTFGLLFAANAVFASLLALVLPAPAFSVLLLLRGGVSSMLNNLIESEAMSAVPDEKRNLYAGFRTISRSAGEAAAAYAAGWILAASDYRLPFLFSGLLLLVCGGYYFRFLQPVLERKTDGRHS